MNKSLEIQRQEIEDKRQSLKKERDAFDLVSKDMEEYRRASTLDANSRE